jgi:hypothetical protein
MNLAKLREEPIGQLVRRKLLYTLFRQSWNVGVTGHPAAVVAGLEGADRQRRALAEVLWMAERRDAFAADPFIVRSGEADDGYRVFYECFPWGTGRGRIDCVPVRGGRFGSASVALATPCHLSYPNIVRHDGELVMIPEHAQSGELALYRLDPRGIVTGKETIDGPPGLLDTTFLEWHGRHWMFATHAGPNDNAELHLYHADALTGPWRAHAHNPVKRDRANARPAGPFIHHAGSVFRPAQDCASHYGAGIVVNRLRTLTEDAFDEEPVSEIRPPSGSRYDFGLHTISSAGDCTVIDGARIESAIHSRLDRLGRYVHPRAGHR